MTADRYRYFRVEARELTDQLGAGVLELERGGAGAPLVGRLLRAAHTLKGAARVMRQIEIADRAHAIEGLLEPHRDGTAEVTRPTIAALLAEIDAIGAAVAMLGGGPATTATPGAPPTPSPSPTPTPAVAPVEPASTVRVELAQVDRVLDGLAELRTRVAQARGRLGALRSALAWEVDQQLDAVERALGETRAEADRLRLVPGAVVFGGLARAIRDAADAGGKEVTLVERGRDERVDAVVAELIQRALDQLVRNAVVHGLEAPAARRGAGKPAAGTVEVAIERRGRSLVFRCRDDGRGVDVEAIRRAVVAGGVPDATARALTTDQLVERLLAGGLSTAGTLTELAGRGIGLDIVREIAARLGGRVALQTEAGRGTAVELVVPRAVSAVDALIVEAGGRRAAVARDHVVRAAWLGTAERIDHAGVESVLVGDVVLPYLALDHALGDAAAARAPARTAIVLGGDAALALGVDRLRGTQELVIRPLPPHCPTADVVAGLWLDADGVPYPLLDPAALAVAARASRPAAAPPPARRPPILVVDDSLTTRMLELGILESAGYEVDLAASGEEGLAMARRGGYGLILVDVEMPGMDGFTFVEQTRADPKLRDVPCFLVTSRAGPADRRRGAEVGARAFIAKTAFDQDELLARIREVVG